MTARRAVLASAAVVSCALPAVAQSSDWTYSATFYGWLPSLNGTLDTSRGEVEVDPTGSDILDALEGAFMGVFTAHNGRWGISADILYAGLGSDGDAPAGLVFDDVHTQTDLTMVTVKGLYRVADGPGGYLNLTGGLRWYDLSTETEFKSDVVDNVKESISGNWTDVTVGVSGFAPLSQDWLLVGSADVGGFGWGDSSDLSWQVFGAVGYSFNETWSAELGYRYLSIEKQVDDADVTLDMFGPMIGVTARF